MQRLIDWISGKKEVFDLVPPVYREPRRLADYYRRVERAAATMQPTTLVHEAYLPLVDHARSRDIERIEDAPTAPAAFDERKAEVIELSDFGRFGPEQIGPSLSLSAATVSREQQMAEAWQHREMERTQAAGV